MIRENKTVKGGVKPFQSTTRDGVPVPTNQTDSLFKRITFSLGIRKPAEPEKRNLYEEISEGFEALHKETIAKESYPLKDVDNTTPWISVNDRMPTKTVLAACYTYDCGRVIDSVWWHKEDETWYCTGPLGLEAVHLPYSHWREMVESPKGTPS